MNHREAISFLLTEVNIENYVYDIRDREMEKMRNLGANISSWDLPAVLRFNKAMAALEHYNLYGEDRVIPPEGAETPAVPAFEVDLDDDGEELPF